MAHHKDTGEQNCLTEYVHYSILRKMLSRIHIADFKLYEFVVPKFNGCVVVMVIGMAI